MRLSELLKTTESTVSSPPKGVTGESSRPVPPVLVSPSLPSQESSSKVPDVSEITEKIRKEIQEQLQKEFDIRLSEIRASAKKSQEELIKSEEEKSFARAEMLKKEKQQMLAQMEELKMQNQQLQASQRGAEESLRKETILSQQKLAETLQKKIAEMEEQLRSRSGDSLEKVTKEIEVRVKEELDTATQDKFNELEQRIKERDREIEGLNRKLQDEKKKAEELPPAAFLKTDPIVSESETSQPKPVVEIAPRPVTPLINSEAARDARRSYEKLVQAGQAVFAQAAAKGSELNLDFFCKTLDEFMTISVEQQEELIGVLVEPYPAQDYFIYHAVNVLIFSLFLGIDLKLEGKDLKNLGLAAFLHDIALLNIKDGLGYPKQLSSELRGDIKKHPERSAEIIAPYVEEVVKTAVSQHHELSNGKGYPHGLLNDEIHLYAKIINIADSFEAMVHSRPYRPKPYEVSEAVKELIEKERGLYDREVVKTLLSRVGLYPVKSYVELSNKQVARVLRQNRLFPISPIIQIEFDEEGNKISPASIIDLSKNQLLHIVGPLVSSHSYTPAKLAKDKKKKESGLNILMVIQGIVPLVIIVGILLLLVYLVLKV